MTTAAIERYQRAQLRREDRNDVQNHPLRLVSALAERFENLQPLGVLDALLQRRIGFHLVAKLIREFVDFDAAQKLFDRFGAHLGDKLTRVFLRQLAVFLFRQNLALPEDGHFVGVHDDESFEVQNALKIAHGNV